jgi:hypothetical protein
MSHTADGRNESILPGRVCGYSKRGGALVNAEYVSLTQHFGASSLVSSVDDLAKWDAALYTEKILKAGSIKEMFTPYQLTNGERRVRIGHHRRGRSRVPEHGGGINGFLASVSACRQSASTSLLELDQPDLPRVPRASSRGAAGRYPRRVRIRLDQAFSGRRGDLPDRSALDRS